MGTRMLGCQIGHDVYSPVTRQKWHSIKHLKEELFETLRGVFVLPNKIKMDLKTLSSHDIVSCAQRKYARDTGAR